jgi:hypothetical protein
MNMGLPGGDTFYFEYAIVGAHALAWLVVLGAYVLGVPLSDLFQVNPGFLVILLPFLYIVGAMVDSASQILLEPFRRRIRSRFFRSSRVPYTDEHLAFASASLYSAYQERVRRIRIIGAAIFNWPLLGAALLLYEGSPASLQYRLVVLASSAFTLLSIVTWRSLYFRAYKFRDNAMQVIASQATTRI